jgi:LmbE family N-acetylglucosaminyl deacetylase
MLCAVAPVLGAQQRDAASLLSLVNGLTVTPRVLVIGMHPDDEDSQLLAWLARGKHVQTAYLSITRGESAGNFLGSATGITLGAVRTQETMAARRIDGAEQFFTRMYDFGFARSDSELFGRWNRDSVLADMVMTIRSFRPHVIVANTPTDTADHDMQHAALRQLAIDAVRFADDKAKFKPLDFGDAWTPGKLLVRGAPRILIDASAYDRTLGATYSDIALRARAQHRSQGLVDLGAKRSPMILLAPVSDAAASDSTLFGGIDTTIARLAPSQFLGSILERYVSHADSARALLHPGNPELAIAHLSRAATFAAALRAGSPTCRHPAAVVSTSSPGAFDCTAAQLDLDASLDLMTARSVAALLGAAGVTIEATADRELVAASDSAVVTLRITNNGSRAIGVTRVAIWGDVDTSTVAQDIAPGASAIITRRVAGLSQRYHWWMGPRAANRYAMPVSSIDGVAREVRMRPDTGRADPAAMIANGVITRMMTTGVAIPEHLRRTSDATVTLAVAGAAVTTSVGPVVFRYADPTVGMQERPIAGVADVTLNLNRALSFVPANTKLDRGIHVSITSHSTKAANLSLRIVTPPGVRDSLVPNAFRLAPRDRRDVEVQIRGTMPPGEKQAFGVIGSLSGRGPHAAGFRTTQYPELLPIRVSWQSGMWLQPVEITVPKTLVVAYVQGVSDDVAMALQDVNVSVVTIPVADLLSWDLKRISTLVFGPRAFEAHPELLQQMPRFMNWARSGGTIVVQRGGPTTLTSGALPYFVDLGSPRTQRVSDPAAPVARVVAAPRVLQWPNLIGADDWKDWISERAPFAPTQVDPKYERVIETQNAGDRPNQNSLLVARVGKGLFIYSALTLDEQIAAGVPGALRIMVNLLSAGLTPPGVR